MQHFEGLILCGCGSPLSMGFQGTQYLTETLSTSQYQSLLMFLAIGLKSVLQGNYGYPYSAEGQSEGERLSSKSAVKQYLITKSLPLTPGGK